MKSFVLAVLAAASVFAGSMAVQAAPTQDHHINGYKFFDDIANRGN
jgi:hypothetical protein